jgi:hypothetical protein
MEGDRTMSNMIGDIHDDRNQINVTCAACGRKTTAPEGGDAAEWTCPCGGELQAQEDETSRTYTVRDGQVSEEIEADDMEDAEAQAREAADLMAKAVTLEVPSRVDVETGPSWGEAA